MAERSQNKMYAFFAFGLSCVLFFLVTNEYVRIVTFFPLWIYFYWYRKNMSELGFSKRKEKIERTAIVLASVATVLWTIVKIVALFIP